MRHGQTIYQTKKKDILYPWPEKTFTRRSLGEGGPVVLTKEGEKQIKEVVEKLKKENIDLIFSSDFFRTRQTAGIISKVIRIKPIFDKRLRDLDMGIFSGGLKENYKNFFTSRKQRFFKRPPKGENWQDVKKRLFDFLKDIEKKYKNKNILIISHGDPLWFLAGIIRGLKTEKEFLKEKYGRFYPNVGQLIIP